MSKSTGNFMTGADAVQKYGADATRITLADAGDAIEDANFEEATANAAILRLFTLKEWIEDQIKNSSSLRVGSKDSFHDRVFENEINRLIQQTAKAYEESLYRDALKNGFYELQSARDWYREVTLQEGMHKDLIFRWINVQALLLSPIAPHWSEYIWREVLSNDGLIVDAKFPEPSVQVDKELLEAAAYVRKIVKTIRDLEISSQKKKKKGKSEDFDPEKPKELKIYVATRFPEWQDMAVEAMKQSYDEETKSFDDIKIRKILSEREILKNKKTMPFVQEFKKKVNEFGIVSFDRSLLFNEYSTLHTVTSFLKRSLGYDKVLILRTVYAISEEEKRVAEVAVPGEPGILFRNTTTS